MKLCSLLKDDEIPNVEVESCPECIEPDLNQIPDFLLTAAADFREGKQYCELCKFDNAVNKFREAVEKLASSEVLSPPIELTGDQSPDPCTFTVSIYSTESIVSFVEKKCEECLNRTMGSLSLSNHGNESSQTIDQQATKMVCSSPKFQEKSQDKEAEFEKEKKQYYRRKKHAPVSMYVNALQDEATPLPHSAYSSKKHRSSKRANYIVSLPSSAEASGESDIALLPERNQPDDMSTDDNRSNVESYPQSVESYIVEEPYETETVMGGNNLENEDEFTHSDGWPSIQLQRDSSSTLSSADSNTSLCDFNENIVGHPSHMDVPGSHSTNENNNNNAISPPYDHIRAPVVDLECWNTDDHNIECRVIPNPSSQYSEQQEHYRTPTTSYKFPDLALHQINSVSHSSMDTMGGGGGGCGGAGMEGISCFGTTSSNNSVMEGSSSMLMNPVSPSNKKSHAIPQHRYDVMPCHPLKKVHSILGKHPTLLPITCITMSNEEHPLTSTNTTSAICGMTNDMLHRYDSTNHHPTMHETGELEDGGGTTATTTTQLPHNHSLSPTTTPCKNDLLQGILCALLSDIVSCLALCHEALGDFENYKLLRESCLKLHHCLYGSQSIKYVISLKDLVRFFRCTEDNEGNIQCTLSAATATTTAITYSNTTTMESCDTSSMNGGRNHHTNNKNHHQLQQHHHRRSEPVLRPEYLKQCDSFHNDPSTDMDGIEDIHHGSRDYRDGEGGGKGDTADGSGYRLLSTMDDTEGSDYSLDFCNFLDLNED